MIAIIIFFWSLFGLGLGLAPAKEEQGNFVELMPLNRSDWDHSLKKRQSDEQTFLLRNQEQFMWTTPKNDSKQTVLSMVLTTKPDEQLVIDMDRFGFALKSVNCTENMRLQFWHNHTFQAARAQWNWVNFNSIRSFVMVPNHPLCRKDYSRHPWLVSDVEYDSQTLTMRLNATEKTWRQVGSLYTIDFGDFVPQIPGAPQSPGPVIPPHVRDKRFLDVDINKAFTVDLNAKIPDAVFEIGSGPNWAVTAGFNDSQTRGTLVFAGHIEASLFGGIDKLELSATPHGIEAEVNFDLGVRGEITFGEGEGTKKINLFTTQTPAGFSIRGLLQLGLTGQLNAGAQLHYIEGEAQLQTGIIGRISDDAVARVDLAAEQPVKISGWLPTIEAKPLQIRAEIDTKLEIFTEIAVAASIIALDELGANVDVALRIPDITIEAAAGYDSGGFCPDDPEHKPFGVKIDAMVGANLKLEGWDQVGDKKDVFLDTTLFVKPDIFHFPPLCFSFGTGSPNSCIDIPENAGDAQYGAAELNQGIEPAELTTRATSQIQKASTRNPYFMTCDSNSEHALFVQEYYTPSGIVKKGGTTPLINPKIGCTQDTCTPDTWEIEDKGPVTKALISSGQWAAEHVYEGNWIRDYLEYLKRTHNTDADGCKKTLDAFAFSPVTIATPDTVTPATNYSEALFQNLGTIYTYNDRMTVLPQKQNHLKYLMFSSSELDGTLKTAKDSKGNAQTNNKRACSIGRIITTCKYMENPKTRAALDLTVSELEKVLANMDDPNNPVPKLPNGASYAAAHKTFFQAFYDAGIKNAQDKIKDYADFVLTSLNSAGNTDTVDKVISDELVKVKANPENYCSSTYTHP